MNRPRVVIHAVASVDGRLTLAPDVLLLYGDERWEAVAGASSDVDQWLKFAHKPQVILEGSGSFMTSHEQPAPLPPVAGDPQELYQDFLPSIIVQRPGQRGWFTVVDSRGGVRWVYKEWPEEGWEGWHLLILVAHQTPAEYLAYLQREAIPYLVAGEQQVDLRLALEKLGAQLGVTCVLCTSPGKLGGALLRAGLVDEINVEFFPAIIGGSATPALFVSPELKPVEWPTRLKLLSAQVQAGGRVWLRYQVVSEKE